MYIAIKSTIAVDFTLYKMKLLLFYYISASSKACRKLEFHSFADASPKLWNELL